MAENARPKRQLAEQSEALAISVSGRGVLGEASEVKSIFIIDKYRAEFSIKAMIRLFQVSRSG